MNYYKLNSPTDYTSYPVPLMETRQTDDGFIVATEFVLDKPEATEEDFLNAKSV